MNCFGGMYSNHFMNKAMNGSLVQTVKYRFPNYVWQDAKYMGKVLSFNWFLHFDFANIK